MAKRKPFGPGDTRETDYTALPVGRVVREWEYLRPDKTVGIGRARVEVCPKCRRNGVALRLECKRGPHAGRVRVVMAHKSRETHRGFAVAVENCEECGYYEDEFPAAEPTAG